MDNDLISREALKKEIKNSVPYVEQERILEIIDNAPTITPEKLLVANVTFDEDKLKEIVQTDVIDKIKSGELVLKAEKPQGELANEVWQLYEKHSSHLATHVIEFGDDLKELLGKYQKKGANNDL